MLIASKEVRETYYWLRLLRDGEIIDHKYIEKPMMESEEIVRMLTSIVKTTAKETKTKNEEVKTQNYGNAGTARRRN